MAAPSLRTWLGCPVTDNQTPRCFIARPVGDHGIEAEKYGDNNHWQHVEEHLLKPALEGAGYEVVPPEAGGAVLIHGNIVKHLETCDLVLADFSSLNPNVLFEAGVRTSVDKPLVIIAEEGTKLPFDTTGINTWFYPPELRPWNVEHLRESLRAHIEGTPKHGNALWSKFGLQTRAADLDRRESPEDALLQILTEEITSLREEVRHVRDSVAYPLGPQVRAGTGQTDSTLNRRIRELRTNGEHLLSAPRDKKAWADFQRSIEVVRVVGDRDVNTAKQAALVENAMAWATDVLERVEGRAKLAESDDSRP